MAIIRNGQIESLSESMQERADRELAKYARDRFPDKFKNFPEERLYAGVKYVRAQAKSLGFEREDDVATFLDFVVMYGNQFCDSPWAAEVLNNKHLHAPDKMAMLRYRVRLAGVDL